MINADEAYRATIKARNKRIKEDKITILNCINKAINDGNVSATFHSFMLCIPEKEWISEWLEPKGYRVEQDHSFFTVYWN